MRCAPMGESMTRVEPVHASLIADRQCQLAGHEPRPAAKVHDPLAGSGVEPAPRLRCRTRRASAVAAEHRALGLAALGLAAALDLGRARREAVGLAVDLAVDVGLRLARALARGLALALVRWISTFVASSDATIST